MPPLSDPNNEISFDSSFYPRTYRASGGYRAFLYVLGVISAVGGLLGTWYFVTGHETHGPREPFVLGSISFLFILLGLYLILFALKSRVELTAEGITIYEFFTAKSLLRSQLQGWRILPTQYTSVLVLVPCDRGNKQIKIALMFQLDESLIAWLAIAPNLDQSDQAASVAELDSNLEIGLTQEQRAERFDAAKKLATRLNWITGIATAWGWFYPRPYGLVIFILAILPALAALIGLRSKGLYQFEGRRNDVRPSLAAAMIFPGATLSIRALDDLALLHWTQILPVSFVICFVLTATISAADPFIRQRRWPILLIFLLTAMYGGGLTAQANALLDRSPPAVYSAQVHSKYVSSGKHTSWHLSISPWGPQTEASDIIVPPRLYNSIQSGQTICLFLHPGALRIPWYVASSCPPNPQAH